MYISGFTRHLVGVLANAAVTGETDSSGITSQA